MNPSFKDINQAIFFTIIWGRDETVLYFPYGTVQYGLVRYGTYGTYGTVFLRFFYGCSVFYGSKVFCSAIFLLNELFYPIILINLHIIT